MRLDGPDNQDLQATMAASTLHIVTRSEEARRACDKAAQSVENLFRDSPPDQVRDAVEGVRAGVLRAVTLLLEAQSEAGHMLGIAAVREQLGEPDTGDEPGGEQ